MLSLFVDFHKAIFDMLLPAMIDSKPTSNPKIRTEPVKLSLRPAVTDRPWCGLWDWLLAPGDEVSPALDAKNVQPGDIPNQDGEREDLSNGDD